MSDAAYAEPVILHRHVSDTEDDSGNEVPQYVDDPNVPPAIIYPNVSSESNPPAGMITAGLTCLWLEAVPVTGLDEITVRGVRYKIQGDPGELHNPHVGEDVTQLQLLRRT